MYYQSDKKRLQFPKDHAPQDEALSQTPFFLLRNGKGPIQDIMEGCLKLEHLTSGAGFNKLEAVVATTEPGFSCWEGKACDGDKWYHILEGTLEIIANETSHILTEGDCIYIDSGMTHIWRNPGETTAKALVLSSEPSTMPGPTGAFSQ